MYRSSISISLSLYKVTFDILTHEPQTDVNAHTRTYSLSHSSSRWPTCRLRRSLCPLSAAAAAAVAQRDVTRARRDVEQQT